MASKGGFSRGGRGFESIEGSLRREASGGA